MEGGIDRKGGGEKYALTGEMAKGNTLKPMIMNKITHAYTVHFYMYCIYNY